MPVQRLAGAHHARCLKQDFPHPDIECECDAWDMLDRMAKASETVMRPTVRLALYHHTPLEGPC